jgi:hypothetical protein
MAVALFSLIFTVVFDPWLSLFSFSDDKIDNMSDSFELHPSKEYHKLRGKCGEFSSSQESKSFVFVFSRNHFRTFLTKRLQLKHFLKETFPRKLTYFKGFRQNVNIIHSFCIFVIITNLLEAKRCNIALRQVVRVLPKLIL